MEIALLERERYLSSLKERVAQLVKGNTHLWEGGKKILFLDAYNELAN